MAPASSTSSTLSTTMQAVISDDSIRDWQPNFDDRRGHQTSVIPSTLTSTITFFIAPTTTADAGYKLLPVLCYCINNLYFAFVNSLSILQAVNMEARKRK